MTFRDTVVALSEAASRRVCRQDPDRACAAGAAVATRVDRMRDVTAVPEEKSVTSVDSPFRSGERVKLICVAGLPLLVVVRRTRRGPSTVTAAASKLLCPATGYALPSATSS